MALPHTVRVKLSSEAAGAISITPVVVQEMPVRELVEHLLGLVGKDAVRIREILRRGSLVSGASRFRWEGWETEPEGLVQMLATFPDADASRLFAANRCIRVLLRGRSRPLEIPRESGKFWNALMDVASAGVAYAGYSYRERADRYAKELSLPEREFLRAASGKLRYRALQEQLLTVVFEQAEFLVER